MVERLDWWRGWMVAWWRGWIDVLVLVITTKRLEVFYQVFLCY